MSFSPGLGRDAGALLGEPQAEGVHQRLGPADELARRRRPGSSSRWHRAARCGPAPPWRGEPLLSNTVSRPRLAWTQHAARVPPAGSASRLWPAIDLHRSPEALEKRLAMLAAAPRRIFIDHADRLRTARHAPSSTGSRSCRAPDREPEPWSRPKVLDVFSAFFRRSYTGPRWNAAFPTGQGRAVQTRAGVDGRLAIEGGVVSVFRDQHRRDGAFGR